MTCAAKKSNKPENKGTRYSIGRENSGRCKRGVHRKPRKVYEHKETIHFWKGLGTKKLSISIDCGAAAPKGENMHFSINGLT